MSQTIKLPKPVYLVSPVDFPKFEETLQTLAEKYLSADWEWTFKVGGKVQRDIERKDPTNEGLYVIRENTGRQNNNNNIFHTPMKFTPERKHEIILTDKKKTPPPPPPPPPNTISKGVADAMGKRAWQVEKMREEEDKFFKINKNAFEEREILPMRKEIWEWVVTCVSGEHKNLFCTHLVRECDKWDIQQLYRHVKDFLHTENYREYGERLERFFTARPREGEDIFTYISRVDMYEEEILHLQHLAQEAGETLSMPKFCKVWKILSAIEKYPDYRIFTERVQLMTPQEWIVLSPENIRTELHKLHSNKVSLTTQKQNKHTGFGVQVRNPPPPPPLPIGSQAVVGGGRAHSPVRTGGGTYQRGGRSHTPTHNNKNRPRVNTPVRYPIPDKLKFFGCPEGVCLGFFRFGKCPRLEKGKKCSFQHTGGNPQHTGGKGVEENKRSRSFSPIHPNRNNNRNYNNKPHTPYPKTGGVQSGGVQSGGVCQKCGNTHTGICSWNKQCFMCGGLHAAKMCTKQHNTINFGTQHRERRNSV